MNSSSAKWMFQSWRLVWIMRDFVQNSNSVNEANKTALHCVSVFSPLTGLSFHLPSGIPLRLLSQVSLFVTVVFNKYEAASYATSRKQMQCSRDHKIKFGISPVPFFYETSPWNKKRIGGTKLSCHIAPHCSKLRIKQTRKQLPE